MNNKMYFLVFIFSCCLLQAIGSNYDANTSQFTPSGMLKQIEYAKIAASKGSPIIAGKFKDGVVLLVGRRSQDSTLLVQGPTQLFAVDSRIYLMISGLLFDGLAVANLAKEIGMKYREIYNCGIPMQDLAEQLSAALHTLTMKAKHRPVGVSVILAGWDQEAGCQIYHLDTEGFCVAHSLVALGASSEKLLHIATANFNTTATVAEGLPTLITDIQQGLNGRPLHPGDTLEDTSDRWSLEGKLGILNANHSTSDWMWSKLFKL